MQLGSDSTGQGSDRPDIRMFVKNPPTPRIASTCHLRYFKP